MNIIKKLLTGLLVTLTGKSAVHLVTRGAADISSGIGRSRDLLGVEMDFARAIRNNTLDDYRGGITQHYAAWSVAVSLGLLLTLSALFSTSPVAAVSVLLCGLILLSYALVVLGYPIYCARTCTMPSFAHYLLDLMSAPSLALPLESPRTLAARGFVVLKNARKAGAIK